MLWTTQGFTTQSSSMLEGFLWLNLMHLCSSQKFGSLSAVLFFGLFPKVEDLLLASGTPWLECHLKRIRLDDQERVRLVQRDLNLSPGGWIYLSLQIECPHQGTASGHGLVASDRHAKALTLTPTERGHAVDCWILGQRLLECRPPSLEPSLRPVGVRVRVFDRIAKERPIEGKDARALRNEISPEPVISFSLMRYT